MKNIFYIVIIILFCSLLSFSQNNPPAISNLSINVDAEKVTINYNVDDIENDSLLITISVSEDSGKTFLFEIGDSIIGDIGFPVMSGNNKTIYWFYNPMKLSSFNSGNYKLKIVASDFSQFNIKNILEAVDSNRLWNNLLNIEGIRHRTSGLSHLNAVRDSLINNILNSGTQLTVDNFNFGSVVGKNIIGRLPGLLDEKVTFIIGGHYDTVNNSPGADDNGTAVAGVLEAITVLSNYKFKNSIEFIFFDLEEDGLIGSKNYVDVHLVNNNYKNIRGALIMEMIGFYTNEVNTQIIPTGFCTLFPDVCDSIIAQQYRGNFLTNVANTNSNSLKTEFDLMANSYVPELRVLSLATPGIGAMTPDLRRSDHAPFWDKGIKALMLTDGANFRNFNYHSLNDVSSSLNKQFFTRSVKATIATIINLAEPINAHFFESDYFSLVTSVKSNDLYSHDFNLYQNYPNPFNPSTVFNYYLSTDSKVSLKIYDVLGNEIITLINAYQSAGSHSYQLTINDEHLAMSSGVYFYQLTATNETNTFLSTKKMIYLK